jgi:hypothetical protein
VAAYSFGIKNHVYVRIGNIAVVIVNACKSLAVTVWQRGSSLALRPVPQYTRWGLYPQAVIIVACLFCFQWWPLIPTIAISFLGVVAVIMAVRADSFSHGERVIYVVIAFALFIVEMRAVYADRDAHDREQATARQQEERNFQEIAGGIQKAIKDSDINFDQVMQRSDRILAGLGDTIKTQTGGDSFAYITFTAEAGYVHFEEKDPVCQQIFGNAERIAAASYFQVAITSHGKYPLREVHATMMDDERRLAAAAEYNKHPEGDWIKAISSRDTEYRCLYLKPQSPEGPSGDVEMLGTYPLPKGNSQRLSIAFRSLNGYWDETLHLGLVNGQWRQCLSVMGPTAKQASQPFIYCEPEWAEGRALAEKDWAFPKPPFKKHPKH